ncbi:hypothetical protein J2R96_008169 [Bradyrhizobium elkanii]|nr:hypothetical protein [Bradyrhizobium elkanii]
MPDVIEVISKTHKRYADLLRKDRELVAQLEEVGQRGRELTAEQNKHIATWQAQQPRHKPQPKLRHQGAADLLGSLLPEQSPEELDPPMPPENWYGAADMREVGAQVEALTEARKLLLIEIEKERATYSKLATEQRQKDYAAVASKVVSAAKSLGDALQAHHEFIDGMRIDGIERKHIRPLTLRAFGELHEPHTPLQHLIAQAIEKGHASEKDRPDWLMPAPLDIVENY